MLYLVNFYRKKRNFKKIYCMHGQHLPGRIQREERTKQWDKIAKKKISKITLFHKQII